MPFLWILFAVLVLLLAAGFAGFQFACAKRCLPPEPLTEDYIRRSSFAKWTDSLFFGAEWFRLQKPETLHVVSYDGKLLSARFLPCDNACGTILLFHGYRSSALLDFGLEVEFLHKQGYNLLLCDQRAHGASQGRFLTFGVRERCDVLPWVTYLAQRLGPEHPMYLSGMSMGATTVLMASCFEFPANVRGIVADCGFTSPWDIMKSVLHARCKWLPAAPLLLALNVFSTLLGGFSLRECSTTGAVAAAKYPILFIHGKADDFVPTRMSQEAYDACASEKRLVLIDGAAHAKSYITDPARVQSALEDFFENHLPKEEQV